MRMHRYFWALAAALLASCADYSTPDEVVNGAVVITQPKPGFDFKPLATYYLDTTIKVVEDDVSTTDPMPSGIADAITANMTALGYTRVDTGNQLADLQAADVGLKMAVLKGTGTVYYPGYWCDYWYYYSCYYGWSYAGSYSFGAAILEMSDLANFSTTPDQPLQIVWSAMVYGVASTSAYNTQRAVEGINRAFGQSPYLAH